MVNVLKKFRHVMGTPGPPNTALIPMPNSKFEVGLKLIFSTWRKG